MGRTVAELAGNGLSLRARAIALILEMLESEELSESAARRLLEALEALPRRGEDARR
ncbi:MAG: hypothetical protein AB1640_07295 [bacterium]